MLQKDSHPSAGSAVGLGLRWALVAIRLPTGEAELQQASSLHVRGSRSERRSVRLHDLGTREAT